MHFLRIVRSCIAIPLYSTNGVCGGIHDVGNSGTQLYAQRHQLYGKAGFACDNFERATSRNQEVVDFTKNMGISCEYIPCETNDEQIAVLKNGTADVMTNVSVTFLPSAKTVASLAPRGLTAVREIRALDRADTATIPIIAMTANAFDDDMEKSKAAGMNAHLAKPIDPKQLYRTLCDLITKGFV